MLGSGVKMFVTKTRDTLEEPGESSEVGPRSGLPNGQDAPAAEYQDTDEHATRRACVAVRLPVLVEGDRDEDWCGRE